MSELQLTRRRFLRRTGGMLAGTLLFAAGPVALLSPSRSWALPMQAFDETQGKVLLTFTRHLYPHKDMEDAVYALVVKDLDAAAAKDPAVRKLLLEGVTQLDRDGAWLKASPQAQADKVKALAGTPFFEKVRSTAVVSLYSNDMAYAYFGYGGAEGDAGYIFRGFNDLTWLPDPPLAASGPVPTV
ncbi:hypothetical protein [Pseudoxanthomonas sp. JBR18]|uniref:hypothetical protein n=1 Tax=Pseudoxanthomonas sp. JBR18 TaxID=2969308 RepID=UPI002304EA7B|nr:hypothetical protein [Pseudoxanthomonas sp. JBR18]WCE05309.1 hypothetical protein PJ250_04895 [Pseudoxanthomonas sp. JBR18]